ncbi:MAG: hypothetical protein J3Q66DRAFT_415201 [Benniella sp.]|nr:MAG: hypothetical protein J3Q66DRAFT_415201 [Benniella sp.]
MPSTESRKKPKKNKGGNHHARNPFADPNNNNNSDRRPSTQDTQRKNLFADNHVLIGLKNAGSPSSNKSEGSTDDSGEEDEERMVKARKDALAAFNPTNSDPKAAEFKSLRSSSSSSSTTQEASSYTDHEPSRHTESLADTTIDVYTPPPPPPFGPSDDDHDSYSESILDTPKANDDTVPEIAISMPTSSPPWSKKQDTTKSSSIDTDPSRPSSIFKPSASTTLSNPFSDASNAVGSLVPGQKDAKTRRRPAPLNSKLFQSVTADSTMETVASNEDVEGSIGTAVDRDPSACPPTSSAGSPKGNTFGTPILQGNQQSRQQQQQQQHGRDTMSKVRRYSLDPWDSDHDMLIPDMDVDQDGRSALSRPTETSLKGMVGGRRSEDIDTSLLGKEYKRRSLFGRGGSGTENWMVHPRTAALRGTFHRAETDDAVPVPIRPKSWDDEFTTVSLESPPLPGTAAFAARNGAALSRTGSLDSSFHRLKKGASALFMHFGATPVASDHLKDASSMARYPFLKEAEEKEDPNGHVHDAHDLLRERNLERGEETDYRSSSLTFGNRKSLQHSTTSPPAMLPSFSSFRNLISTAARLGRSTSLPGNVPPPSPPPPPSPLPQPSFSPSAFIRRSQTTTFGGDGAGGSGSSGHYELCVGRISAGQVSFSPVSRPKYTSAMIPTIVVPLNTPKESSCLCPLDSIPSSDTIFSSDDVDEELCQQQQGSSSSHPYSSRVHDHNNNDNNNCNNNSLSACSDHQQPWIQAPQGSLIQVPEPAKTIVRSYHLANGGSCGGSVTMATMHASGAATTTTVTKARDSWTGSTLEQGRALHTSRTPTSISADSLTGPLMGEDSIGQFERKRAMARGERGVFATSTTASTTTSTTRTTTTTMEDSGILQPPTAAAITASAATIVCHSSSCIRCSNGSVVFMTSSSSSSSSSAAPHAGKGGQGEHGQGGGGTWTAIQSVQDFEPSLLHNDDVGSNNRYNNPPIVSVGKGPRTWAGLFGFLRGTSTPPPPSTPPASRYNYHGSGNNSNSCSKKSRHGHHLSGHSDISEKWMQLPEPSRSEGMCSNRGVINITSMVLILCGLVLLVLGYPIAASLRKDPLAEAQEAAAASAASASTASTASTATDAMRRNNGTVLVIHPVQLDMAN